MLCHDRDTNRFVGPDFAVPHAAFLARMRELLRDGWTLSRALSYLLDERAWSVTMPGVEPLLRSDEVLAQAEALLATRRRR